MTGFGEARTNDDRWSVTVEVRTVNNRHLKLQAKLSDPYGSLEPDFEKLVRESIRRGTVTLSLRVDRPRSEADYRLNLVALRSYQAQLTSLAGQGVEVDLVGLLVLPGIVEERKPATDDPHADWPRSGGRGNRGARQIANCSRRGRPGDGQRVARPGREDRWPPRRD